MTHGLGAEPRRASRRASRRPATISTSRPATTSVEDRHQVPVELDRAHVHARVGQLDGERSDTRADLDDTVARLELGEPHDAARGVRVGEEVLTQRLRRPDSVARRAARGSRSASPLDAEDAPRSRASIVGDLVRSRHPARARARPRPPRRTRARSGLPRYGSGARNGESVSTSTRSAGRDARRRRATSSAFLNDTMPLNDR